MSSANNKEALSGLNRFLSLKSKQAGALESNPNLRPKYVQSEKSLPQAEKWRTIVLSEISVKLTKINDPSVNDFQIRDLNDDLNKLFKEKRAWEYHIRDLGGPDYISLKNGEVKGLEVNGYRYFGRAKELPDAKSIIEQRNKNEKEQNDSKAKDRLRKRIIDERLKRIDGRYYGIYDDYETQNDNNDKVLNELQDLLIEESDVKDESYNNYINEHKVNDLSHYEKEVSSRIIRKQLQSAKKSEDIEILDFPYIPSNEEVNQWLIETKKKNLLSKLANV